MVQSTFHCHSKPNRRILATALVFTFKLLFASGFTSLRTSPNLYNVEGANRLWDNGPCFDHKPKRLRPKEMNTSDLFTLLLMAPGKKETLDASGEASLVAATSWPLVGLFGGVGCLYWYWMVLGSLAASQDWAGIPDWLPLVPGWPPSDADLQPVLDDSQHFFYLSELLQNPDAPYVQPVRLAAFNVAEAWIFAFLPLLWSDPRRLNKWVLLLSWSILGINLTNAFLAPYLLVTELKSASSLTDDAPRKNRIFSAAFAAVSSSVVFYSLFQCLTTATTLDWNEMTTLIQTDRTYLAFVVDLFLFSLFQPIILSRVRNGNRCSTDPIPLVGLLCWLLESPETSEQ